MRKLITLILPLIPLTIGVVSTFQSQYDFERTVILLSSCLLVATALILLNRCPSRSDWFLAAAYVCCIGGDSFLFHRHNSQILFIMGIVLFCLTHLNYFALMISNGRINKWCGAIITSLLLIYFAIFLLPRSDMGMPMKIAVLVYLLLSCLNLSTAFGLRRPLPEKILFICAISLMMISDTTISFKEFLHWEKFNFLLMPTYHYSLIFMCLAMGLKLYRSADRPDASAESKP